MREGSVRGVVGHIRREVMGSIREVLGKEGEVKGDGSGRIEDMVG